MLLPSRCRTALSGAAVTLAAAALFAAPASAAGAAPAGPGCPAVPTVQPFAPWQDFADYLLAPDGDLEAGGASWDLDGDARIVEGNEPWKVGGASDHRALDVPAGDAATTASMCIGPEHRTMRFFANSSRLGAMTVEALYTTGGRQHSVTLGAVRGGGAWAPTEVLPMRVDQIADALDTTLQVKLRFTAYGVASWRVDDVYVDPYRMK